MYTNCSQTGFKSVRSMWVNLLATKRIAPTIVDDLSAAFHDAFHQNACVRVTLIGGLIRVILE